MSQTKKYSIYNFINQKKSRKQGRFCSFVRLIDLNNELVIKIVVATPVSGWLELEF